MSAFLQLQLITVNTGGAKKTRYFHLPSIKHVLLKWSYFTTVLDFTFLTLNTIYKIKSKGKNGIWNRFDMKTAIVLHSTNIIPTR